MPFVGQEVIVDLTGLQRGAVRLGVDRVGGTVTAIHAAAGTITVRLNVAVAGTTSVTVPEGRVTVLGA